MMFFAYVKTIISTNISYHLKYLEVQIFIVVVLKAHI
jgi:hypothetical protein